MRQDQPQDDAQLPSRSRLRREALDIFKVAEALAALGDAQLDRTPLAGAIREEVIRTRAITSHIAHKRQMQFLAKQLRGMEDADLDAIRDALDHDRVKAQRETAATQRIEIWRERLLDEGDDALAEFVVQHPDADRQRLRQLVRNARVERTANKAPHAYRELFRVVRGALCEAE